ncbi:hypothetical protein [Winogradskyella sp.]|uniref:hypothetical protein n=1 Tax=Winogradskyella sp. TaxID=1883156 RepID=UPI003BA93FC5
MKLKAGALQLVTFVVVVIALLLAAFVLLLHVHRQFRIKSNHTIATVALVNTGIHTLLHNHIPLKDTVSVSLNDEAYKSLKVHRDFWGSFEKVHVKAKIKRSTLGKTALVGNSIAKQNCPSLYLKDNNKPLVLVGQTTIKGEAHLPKRGVKSGNIAGQSYYGEHYIYGKTFISKALPELNSAHLDYLKHLKEGNLNTITTDYINPKGQNLFKNAFENPLQRIYDPLDMVLAEVTMIGHIVIKSDTKITVHSTAHLTDVLLIAPVIEIAANVSGSFQAFATEYIHIAKDVHLSYPSALVLQQDDDEHPTTLPRGIVMDDNSSVSGQILVLGQTQAHNYEAQLKISANALVEGLIYCEQNLELRGTVYGAVYTDNFIIKEAGAVYQNHLFNALIDANKLPSAFVSLDIGNSKKGVAKWLY